MKYLLKVDIFLIIFEVHLLNLLLFDLIQHMLDEVLILI
jgi:hypothetical protein